MAVFDNFPYSNNHELNLDWIIKRTEEISQKADTIDANVDLAVQSAENASQSELNAKASEDASADYYTLTSQLVGKPLAANTAAEMTDTTTIYIYTGDEAGYEPGDWYYYDGSAWQDGGVYGADGGINTNARNLLRYILEHVAYTDPGMQIYVDALYEALKTGGEVTETFMIVNALENVTNSNPAASIAVSASYSATLTADAGYSLGTVTVTMGGVDITSTAYNNGVITITSVTGDVVITATATAAKYNWSLSNGDFTITPGSCSIQNSTYDVYVDTRATSLAHRRYVYISSGVKPFYTTPDGSNYSVTNPPEYPIPVPDDATSVTYTITPNTQYMGLNLIAYNEGTGLYTIVHSEGWQQGSHTLSFTAAPNQFITLVTKYDSAGQSYPTEPSEITVVFNN